MPKATRRKISDRTRGSPVRILPVLAKLPLSPVSDEDLAEQAWSLASLSTLLLEDEKQRSLLLSQNVVGRVLYALQNHAHLRTPASAALRTLCVDQAAVCRELVKKGGLDALTSALQSALSELAQPPPAPAAVPDKPLEAMNKKERRHAARQAQAAQAEHPAKTEAATPAPPPAELLEAFDNLVAVVCAVAEACEKLKAHPALATCLSSMLSLPTHIAENAAAALSILTEQTTFANSVQPQSIEQLQSAVLSEHAPLRAFAATSLHNIAAAGNTTAFNSDVIIPKLAELLKTQTSNGKQTQDTQHTLALDALAHVARGSSSETFLQMTTAVEPVLKLVDQLIQLQALDVLHNLVVRIAQHAPPPPSENGDPAAIITFREWRASQPFQQIYDAVLRMSRDGEPCVDTLWSVAQCLEGGTGIDEVMAWYHAHQNLQVECIGLLSILGRNADNNYKVGRFIVEQLENGNGPQEALVEAVIDMYADENSAWDHVLRDGKFVERLRGVKGLKEFVAWRRSL